jgi:3-isopropylmalate/(R)-2-methylmalate dehydratase small subunit
MEGRVHEFGDNVNTDEITPSDYFGEPLDVIASHLFEPIRPDFTNQVTNGDIIVAGKHFGAGSNRITAPLAIQEAGLAAIVAESFARIFYRNAIAVGFPVVTCPDVRTIVRNGDVVRVDFERNTVQNRATGEQVEFEPIPRSVRSIFETGGLIEHYRSHPEGLRLDDDQSTDRVTDE